MKKFSFLLVMLAMALALGLAFMGCKSEVEDPLNGTWIYGSSEYNFTNGKYSYKYDGVDNHRGTYTSGGNILTTEVTDIYVSASDAAEANTTAGWKNKSQYTEIMKGMGLTDAQISAQFADVNINAAYTLTDNTLTWDGRTFNRR